jgi:hypothetical protein
MPHCGHIISSSPISLPHLKHSIYKICIDDNISNNGEEESTQFKVYYSLGYIVVKSITLLIISLIHRNTKILKNLSYIA